MQRYGYVEMSIELLEATICDDVQEYWRTFGEPIELMVLGRRYARASKSLGTSLTLIIAKLKADTKVHILITSSGKRFAYPHSAWTAMDTLDQENAPTKLLKIAAQRKALNRELVNESRVIHMLPKLIPFKPKDPA